VSKDDFGGMSRKISIVRRAKEFMVTTFGGYFTLDYFNAIPEYVQKFQAIGLSKQAWALIGVCGSLWIVASLIEYLHHQDFKNGNYTPSKFVENEVSKEDEVL
jgi:hypothetical protein